MRRRGRGEVGDLLLFLEDIVDHVASYVVNGGDMKDFENASLVCKQFFVIFQRRLLRYHISFSLSSLLLPPAPPPPLSFLSLSNTSS